TMYLFLPDSLHVSHRLAYSALLSRWSFPHQLTLYKSYAPPASNKMILFLFMPSIQQSSRLQVAFSILFFKYTSLYIIFNLLVHEYIAKNFTQNSAFNKIENKFT